MKIWASLNEWKFSSLSGLATAKVRYGSMLLKNSSNGAAFFIHDHQVDRDFVGWICVFVSCCLFSS